MKTKDYKYTTYKIVHLLIIKCLKNGELEPFKPSQNLRESHKYMKKRKNPNFQLLKPKRQGFIWGVIYTKLDLDV